MADFTNPMAMALAGRAGRNTGVPTGPVGLAAPRRAEVGKPTPQIPAKGGSPRPIGRPSTQFKGGRMQGVPAFKGPREPRMIR